MNRISGLAMFVVLVIVMCGCETTGTPPPPPPDGDAAPAAEAAAPAPAPSPLDAAPAPASSATPAAGGGLALSQSQVFSDIPLPENVKENQERTYIYKSGSFRIGRMVYKCKAPVEELSAFYHRECPAAGWQGPRENKAEGWVRLEFKKENMRLEISIRDRGGMKRRELILELTPESVGQPSGL